MTYDIYVTFLFFSVYSLIFYEVRSFGAGLCLVFQATKTPTLVNPLQTETLRLNESTNQMHQLITGLLLVV
jgi:hypothetical protein